MLPASWKNLNRTADVYYFHKGTVVLAMVIFECVISLISAFPSSTVRFSEL